ncbi:MAG: GMC family oxidoreductase [Sandaracinus sp.]|nr:GMC family oxidoreductase [Sandaracinus sp.]
MPRHVTDLRADRATLGAPMPKVLLKTFETYLPHLLGVTDPSYSDLVSVATKRFDAYVRSIPPDEGVRDELVQLLALTFGFGMLSGGFPQVPWKQDAARREAFVRRLYTSDETLMDRFVDVVRFVSRLVPSAPRASIRDLAKSLRELASLAFYSNPGSDMRVTGYQPIQQRDYSTRGDVDVVELRRLGQPDLFDPKEVASIFQEHHPYDLGRLFANDGRPKIAVIGSGAGGAVVAARLAQTGRYDVAIFESGPRMRPGEYPLDTFVGMSRLFEGGLMTLSRNLDIHLLRGRVVGGGTVMTSGLSVKMRAETMDRWCSTAGELAIGVTRAELEAGFDAVHAVQHMGPLDDLPDALKTGVSEKLREGAEALTAAGEPSYDLNADDPQNNVMMRASQAPGGRPDQNGDYCFGCGLCNYGCHFGHKLSMDLSYLPMAEAAGAKIHPNLPIDHLVGDVEHGRLKIKKLMLGRGLGPVDVDHVVLAAGAVGTPALLLRSVDADGTWRSLRVFDQDDGHVGKGLGFNYGSGVVARWLPSDADALRAREIAQSDSTAGPYPSAFAKPGHLGFQIRYVATKAGDPEFRIGIDPKRDPLGRANHIARYVLENAFVPPSLVSNVVPGVGAAHLDWMRDYRSLAMCATTIGSPQTGYVLGDRTVVYKLSQDEMTLNREALASIVRLYFAAGASEVGLAGVREDPHDDAAPPGEGLRLTRSQFGGLTEAQIATKLERVLSLPEHIMLSSAHPQGGCRMSVDPARGAVGPDFRLFGADNLFVCDGSLFPSTIVVNPQWSIAALAEVASQRIRASIG